MQIYIDGEFYGREDAKISVFDHGLLYGDGVFEGIRVYSNRIFEFEAHIDRLYDSAKAIEMTIPLAREELVAATCETVRRNGVEDGYIRLVVTRGVGDLGLSPLKCPTPTVFIIASAIQLYPEELYEKGLEVITTATRRNSPQAINPSIKSLNYLNNILASLELQGTGAHEGLMLTADGYVSECAADNVFLVKGDKVMTPSPAVGALRGITRQVALRLAEELGYRTEEGLYTLYDVYTADEFFVTGTAAEVAPVVQVDRRPIGDGTPGPVTRRLIARFREFARENGHPVHEG